MVKALGFRAAGVILTGHGAQKLFGSVGGPRISGFAKVLEQLGVKPAIPMAILAGRAELSAVYW